MNDRLYRSRTDRMLAGVAGGLAEMWGVDPSLVRIAWALLVVLTGGLALLVYVVMAIVVPEGEPGPTSGPPAEPSRSAAGLRPTRAPRENDPSVAVIGGLLLIGLGAFFLVREFLPAIDFDVIWPLVLIGIGVTLVVVTLRRDAGPTRPDPAARAGATDPTTSGTSVTPTSARPSTTVEPATQNATDTEPRR